MFRTVSPSIIRSLRLYIQHEVYAIQVLWLLASGNEMELSLLAKVPRVCNGNSFSVSSRQFQFTIRGKWIIKNVKLFVHFMKAYSRNGGITPLIRILGTTGRWVVSLTPPPFYSRVKRSMCPLSRRLGGPQFFFIYLIEKTKWLSLPEFEPRIIHPIAYTEQYFRALPFF